MRGGSSRLSDIRVAIYGPAALTALARRTGELHHALPKKSFYAVHAEPRLFFDPSDFSALIRDPGVIGLHVSPKGRGSQPPIPGSLYAWAAERFGAVDLFDLPQQADLPFVLYCRRPEVSHDRSTAFPWLKRSSIRSATG